MTVEDLIGMDMLRSNAEEWTGLFPWTFQDGKATTSKVGELLPYTCEATYAVVEDFVRITYTRDIEAYGGRYEVDDIQWRLDHDGLPLHLVAIENAPFDGNKAYLEAKPWQRIE